MSMIFKGQTNEAELGSKEARMARTLGMDNDLDKEEVIDVLNHVSVRLAATGEQDGYRKVNEVIDELNTWTDSALTIEY